MNNERIWTLVAKKLAGEATAEDILELYDLLKENPEVHYSLEIFDELWQQNQFAKDRPVAAYARLLKKWNSRESNFLVAKDCHCNNASTPPGSRPKELQKRSYGPH